jgi:hypothetical protein
MPASTAIPPTNIVSISAGCRYHDLEHDAAMRVEHCGETCGERGAVRIHRGVGGDHGRRSVAGMLT